MRDPKKPLTIALTEPAVFLRSSDPSGRLSPGPNDPPALVRGILTLSVDKPVVISSIEAELTGLLTVHHSQEITSLHAELLDKHKVYSSIVSVFRADQASHGRRPASVGPGSSAAEYDSNETEHAAIASSRRPSPSRRHSERRGALSVLPDPGPTPPYARVAQSPTTDQTMFRTPVEECSQTPEEIRRALCDTLEGQEHPGRVALARPPSTSTLTFPPYTTTHSNVSSESLHQLSDRNHHDLAHLNRYAQGDISHHVTDENALVRPHRGDHPSRAPSCEDTNHTPSQPPTGRSSRDSSEVPAGRSHLRFSLSSVLDAFAHRSRGVPGSEERERGRPRDRTFTGEHGMAGPLGVADVADAQPSSPTGRMEHREHHLLSLGRIFGLDPLERMREARHDEPRCNEHGTGWREFKPGTYSYPISFLLPPNLPPSFAVPHGSLIYTIKGVAHRPGMFTSKLSCQVPLSVVAAPALGAGESNSPGEFGPLLVQKHWEGKLAYTFGLSSRLFLLSPGHHLEAMTDEATRTNVERLQADAEARTEAAYGTATLDLTLLPLEKIKVWKLSAFVDQRITYADEERMVVRADDKRRVRLLEIQDICPAEEMGLLDEQQLTHVDKHQDKRGLAMPLLPTPLSPHRSPLLQHMPPSADASVLAGPGPYTLSVNIGLPGRDGPSGQHGSLHFTVKHKTSCVRVEHSLRVVLRVEQVGDEHAPDHEDAGKKKMFDIAVQTPITILSHDSIPEYQILPRYFESVEDGLHACQSGLIEGPIRDDGDGFEIGHHVDPVGTPSSAPSLESADCAGHSHSHSHSLAHEHHRDPRRYLRARGHLNPLVLPVMPLHSDPSSSATDSRVSPSHTPGHAHHHQHSASYTVSTFHVHAHPHSTPMSSPLSSRPPSPVTRYERLVSGLESEAGEAPPSYESISSVFE